MSRLPRSGDRIELPDIAPPNYLFAERYPLALKERTTPIWAVLFPSGLDVDSDKQRAFLTAIAGQHDRKLRRFLESRLRNAMADVPDLMQEVFLRLMRVPDPDSIRTPEAYLFTVAKAVLHQHRARRAAVPEAVDIMDVLAEIQEEGAIGPEGQVNAEQRLMELQRALAQLPRKAYVTLVLSRIAGMPLAEIGEHLGISRPMVKKYLAQALSACRRHDQEIG